MNLSQRRSIAIRLAQENDGMYGVFRVSGSRWLASIEGICGEFRTGADLRNPEKIDLDKLFFYGVEKEFILNFKDKSVGTERMRELFPQYMACRYVKGTLKDVRSGEGYASIPVDLLDLNEERKQLLAEVLAFYAPIITNPTNLIRTDIPNKENARAYTSSITHLKRYPEHLRELAEAAGYYLKFNKVDNLDYKRDPQLVKDSLELPEIFVSRPSKSATIRTTDKDQQSLV